MSGTHSLLAPSGATTWARCAAALRAAKGLPNKSSKDAASGTCTHWLSEQRLKTGAKPEDWIGQELEFDGYKFVVDSDRCDRANAYVDAVLREPGDRYIEHRLNTSPILGPPGQEGHSDCVTVDPLGVVVIEGVEHQGVVSVHDLKDGAGLVYARNNLQGLIYGASALYEFDLIAPLRAVRFVVHQPRMKHYDEWSYSRAEIEAFITIIRPAAKLAYDLYHGFEDLVPALHFNPGEEQCQWCPVRGSCSARASKNVATFTAATVDAMLAHMLTDDQVAERYVLIDEVVAWAKDLHAEALRRALSGRTITGHKLIRGRRGDRYYPDPEKAEEALATVLPPEEIFQPRELITPPQAEKLLKKKLYDEVLKKYVDQPDGNLTLAPLDHKSPAVKVEAFTPVPELEDLA